MLLTALYITLVPVPTDTIGSMDSIFVISNPAHLANQGSSIVELSSGDNLSTQLSNSAFYTKNYGPSGISTLGLRGAQANHTQIIWHGIPINNPMLGQTDLQTLSTNPNDKVELNQSANASVYGSGALGGSIAIYNKPEFNNGFQQYLSLAAGSFGSRQLICQSRYSSKQLSFSLGLNHSEVQNNYPIVIDEVEQSLLNAELRSLNLSFSGAYKINEKGQIKTVIERNNSNRNLPQFFTNTSSDRLSIYSTRWMVEGLFKTGDFHHGFNTGLIKEEYNHVNQANSNGSKSESELWIGKYWTRRTVVKDLSIEVIAEIQKQTGKSLSYSETQSLLLPAAIASLKYNLKKVSLNIQNRYDFMANKNIGKFNVDVFISKLRLYGNMGNSFRRPSLNELFWQSNSARNIKPENGYFSEIGSEWKSKALSLNMALFARSLENEIIWVPNGTRTKPINLANTRTQGLSSQIKYAFTLKKIRITLFSQIELVNAKTRNNTAEQWRKSIFIPGFSQYYGISAIYKHFSLGLNQRYTSFRYTNLDNSEYLEGFRLAEISLKYQLDKLTIGFNLNNVGNQIYFIQPGQQMPTRQYQIKVTYKI